MGRGRRRGPASGPVTVRLAWPFPTHHAIILASDIQGRLWPVHKRAQNISSLIAVLVLAAALTAVASGRVIARSTLQISPPDGQSPISPTATLSPARPTATLPAELATPAPTGIIPPATAMPTAPPEPAPGVQVTEAPVAPAPTAANPTVPGFLPAPTLTNPDELRSNPPVVYRPTPAPPDPTPEPAPTPVTLAGLIREGIVALSYLWLCMGVFLLIGLGAAAVWLARRNQSHGR